MNSKKRIAILGTVGVPANYGGFETLAENLVGRLRDEFAFTVYCSKPEYAEHPQTHAGASLVYLPLRANGAQSIPYDILSLVLAAQRFDGLLLLGVSGCVALPLFRLFSRKTLIVNIDGLEWRREKWSGPLKWFLKFSEAMAVRFADHVITDNKVIQDYVASEYGRASELIAYGGDQASQVALDAQDQQTWPFTAGAYSFSVCRIEPENNIHLILEAYAGSGLTLVIVGNWQNSPYGIELRQAYATYANINLLDPIYEPDRLNRLRSNCALYVHGHSAGGTNPSLVEAMWLGLPVMAFDVNFNRETTEGSGQYFGTADELRRLAADLLGQEDARRALGAAMHEIAFRRYRWEVIARQYSGLIQRALENHASGSQA